MSRSLKSRLDLDLGLGTEIETCLDSRAALGHPFARYCNYINEGAAVIILTQNIKHLNTARTAWFANSLLLEQRNLSEQK